MNLLSKFIVWIWLLGLSFLVPITLPVGGAQQPIVEYKENHIGSTFISLKEFNLLTSANNNAGILTRVNSGTPVNVLKVWNKTKSEQWLLVNVLSQNYYQLFYKRGWVNIRTS